MSKVPNEGCTFAYPVWQILIGLRVNRRRYKWNDDQENIRQAENDHDDFRRDEGWVPIPGPESWRIE